MAGRKQAEPWDAEEAGQITGLVTSGSGIDEVCAFTRLTKSQVDARCRATFGEGFEAFAARQKLIGKAMFNKALFDAACAGNAKAMDMYARIATGYSPLSTRDGPARGKPKGEALEL